MLASFFIRFAAKAGKPLAARLKLGARAYSTITTVKRTHPASLREAGLNSSQLNSCLFSALVQALADALPE